MRLGHILQWIGLVDIDLHHARLNDVEKLLCHSNHRLALGAAALKRLAVGRLDLSFSQARVPYRISMKAVSISWDMAPICDRRDTSGIAMYVVHFLVQGSPQAADGLN